MFSGRLKITVIEAKGLQLTNVMAIGNRNSIINLNPYVTIDVDKVSIDRTSTKLKTVVPTWNETYSTEFLRNAKEVGFTIFHDATIPPSSFIANCAVQITKLNENGEAIWVSFFFLIIKIIMMLKGICITHVRERGTSNVFLLVLTIFVMGFTGALGNGPTMGPN